MILERRIGPSRPCVLRSVLRRDLIRQRLYFLGKLLVFSRKRLTTSSTSTSLKSIFPRLSSSKSPLFCKTHQTRYRFGTNSPPDEKMMKRSVPLCDPWSAHSFFDIGEFLLCHRSSTLSVLRFRGCPMHSSPGTVRQLCSRW